MGLANCSEYTNYEPRENSQKIIYLIMTALYIVLEIYTIIETIKVFKTQKNVLKNYVLLICHGCIHLLYIRDIVFMPGGALICYEKTFYRIISTYLYILKHIIIDAMMYQIICILLESYTIPARKRKLKYYVLILGACDFTLFTGFFIYSAVDGGSSTP